MMKPNTLDVDAEFRQEGFQPLAPPTSQERLQASRLALQAWIDKTYHNRLEEEPAASRPESDAHDPGWLSVVSDALMDIPKATIVMRWIKRWWRHHPWRITADVAALAGRELAQPLASKHPWLLLCGAAVAGGLLAKAKPWRWVSGSSLLTGLLPPFSVASIFNLVTSTLSNRQPPQSSQEQESTLDEATPSPS